MNQPNVSELELREKAMTIALNHAQSLSFRHNNPREMPFDEITANAEIAFEYLKAAITPEQIAENLAADDGADDSDTEDTEDLDEAAIEQ